jgi:hypothetical protein
MPIPPSPTGVDMAAMVSLYIIQCKVYHTNRAILAKRLARNGNSMELKKVKIISLSKKLPRFVDFNGILGIIIWVFFLHFHLSSRYSFAYSCTRYKSGAGQFGTGEYRGLITSQCRGGQL